MGRHRNLTAAVLGAILVIASNMVAGCGSESTGEPATGFSGVTLDGTEVSLSGYQGRPLVLSFMASW